MDCLFCKIVENKIPSFTIYDDKLVKVFLDIEPKANGHLLIIPKKHFVDIKDIDFVTLTHINKVIKEMYGLLEKKLNISGLTIIQNNGNVQEVKHFHVHLIPKYKTSFNKLKKPKLKPISEMYDKLK